MFVSRMLISALAALVILPISSIGADASPKADSYQVLAKASSKGTKNSKKKAEVKDSTAKADSVAKKSDYDKLFAAKHEIAEGMIKLHLLKGKVYFEMPLSLLEREMLLGSTITEISDNGVGIVGSKPSDPIHFKFTKFDKNIQLRLLSSDYATDDPNSGIADAIKRSNIGAIYKSFSIAAYSHDSTAVVFDMTNLFVADEKQMLPFDSFSYYSLNGYKCTQNFKKDRSYVSAIKSFSDNLSVSSTLSYEYTVSKQGKTLIQNNPFTAIVTRSIILLDEQPARSRIGDSRMSVFPSAKYFIESKGAGVKYAYYSHKWNLQPSDSAAYLRGELVEPVKPIVFYIDNNFPEDWKAPVREGVNQWNEMFETIGFKNAIVAKDFPTDDPEFDPDNLKYSCVRYAPVSIANAMGPSWTDPRSGEIIAASVYIYHDIAKLLRNWMFVQISPANPRLRHTKLPDEEFADGLRYVVSHEVGHCLGYMHNMSASYQIPVDSLRSPSFTQRYGTTTSIMDYARFNYVAQPGDYERGVKLTPPRFGVYDQYAIKWLYTAFPDKTEQEEQEILLKWLQDASKNPLYAYGMQMMPVWDPRAQNEDLGNDAVRASEYGIANLKYILNNLNSWVASEDSDLEFRSEIYSEIVSQYITYINHIYTNIGGIYLKEVKEGDEGEPYTIIPKERQRAAFNYICQQFEDLDWLDNQELLAKLPVMGSAAAKISKTLADAIIKAPQKTLSFGRIGENNYSFSDCSQDVFDFVWKNTKSRKQLTAAQKYLQEMYVKSLIVYSGAAAKVTVQPSGITNPLAQEQSFVMPEYKVEMPEGFHKSVQLNEVEKISGYNAPRMIFYTPERSASSQFGDLIRSRDILKKAASSAPAKDKAHYQYLLKYINNSIESE